MQKSAARAGQTQLVTCYIQQYRPAALSCDTCMRAHWKPIGINRHKHIYRHGLQYTPDSPSLYPSVSALSSYSLLPRPTRPAAVALGFCWRSKSGTSPQNLELPNYRPLSKLKRECLTCTYVLSNVPSWLCWHIPLPIFYNARWPSPIAMHHHTHSFIRKLEIIR